MEFKELNLLELDKDLSDEERAEWQAIYASYRSGSVISGDVAGVDRHEFSIVPPGKKKAVKQVMRCIIVIKYRIRIIIPETEVFSDDFESAPHILRSMHGANIKYVITYINREEGFAVASRKAALDKMRYITMRRGLEKGQVIDVEIVSVGKGVCTAHYGGFDVRLSQPEVSYSIVPDMREKLCPGDVKKALVTEYNAKEKLLRFSIKAMTPHPFDGVETRHPINATRIAHIVGKYGGGVFCRLHDKITDVLCSYETLQYDGDFKIGDVVEIRISKYNFERKLVYGKIIRKIRSK